MWFNQSRRAPGELFAAACLGFVTLCMAARLFVKIDRYAVNILFSDQWNTYAPLFYDYGFWRSFSLQHGPPRLGLGMLVTEMVAHATGWNARAEAFASGSILLLATVAAIYLKRRLFDKLTLWDSLIPLICLGLPQIAAHTVVPFPAYSAVPILLLMGYGICLTFRSIRLRYGALALLNFLLTFSCWGIFLGLLTPVLLGYLVYRHAAAREPHAVRWAAVALAASLFTLVLFFTDYHFRPAVECFHFPHEPLRDYLWFVAHLFSYSLGVPCGAHRAGFTKGFGTILLLTFVIAAASRLWKLARTKGDEPMSLVIVVFIGFTFMFAVNAAVGRVCIGSCAANAERYQALLIPAWLGMYWTVAAMGDRIYRVTACLLILSLCFLLPQARGGIYESGMRYYSESKRRWRDCYREKGDATACDQEVGMTIIPPHPSLEVQGRLDYLKQRHLNLFAEE